MEERKSKKNKKQIYTVLMLICAVVFFFALYKVVTILMDYKAIDCLLYTSPSPRD